jgi:large subunit ribosomal protein L9
VKIVLRDHVEHLGERGDIVSVAPGYARNFLLPKGLAYLATPGNLKVLEHQRRVWEVKEAKELGEAKALAERIAALELSIVKKSGESGTLYGSVTATEVAELLSAKGIEVDRRRLVITEPIKSVGNHEIAIKLHRGVTASVKIEVQSEGGVALPAVEPEAEKPSEETAEAGDGEDGAEGAE